MIREATLKDKAACIALWNAAGLTRSWNDPVADFIRALEQPQSTIFLAMRKDEVMGSAMVGDDGHRGWVYYVATHPDHRRQGIAKKLMHTAEDWLQARGCLKLNLMIREGNETVAAFYRKLGYEAEERTTMAKRL
ncbi:MAG: GNAT family acetyltransferase [Alphaproteobacteria bacterium]